MSFVHPLPCVHEQPGVLEFCTTCGPAGEARHVRGCDLHEKCTRGLVGPGIRWCGACGDYKARTATAVHTSATGIGDAVCGLYAACGLASATGEPVDYHTRHPGWFAGVSHPGVRVVPGETGGADASGDYDGQRRAAAAGTCPSRAQWYCDQLAARLNVPAFRPRRPQTVDRPAPVLEPGYVLLAPFSHYWSREWPGHRWVELALRVALTGRQVVAIGRRDDRVRLEDVFRPTTASWYWGMDETWVSAAVAHADLTVGNDSGIPHIAGLHRAKALAVMTHFRGPFVFGAEGDSVREASADPAAWPCLGCAWEGAHGYRAECDAGCPAIKSIIPTTVLQLGMLDVR